MMGKYATGLENFTMHFQGVFLWCIAVIDRYIGLMAPYNEPTSFHGHIACDDCCFPLNEEYLTLEAEKLPEIPIIKPSRLLFSSLTEIDLFAHSLPGAHLTYIPLFDNKKCAAQQLAIILLGGDSASSRK